MPEDIWTYDVAYRAGWSFVPDPQNPTLPAYGGPPTAEEACPAIEQEWEQGNCDEHYNASPPNGCGAADGGWMNSFIPQYYLNAQYISIGGYCNAHDQCYGDPRASQQWCDQVFGQNLENGCAEGNEQWRTEAVEQGLSGEDMWRYVADRRYECQGFARMLSGAVMTFGSAAYVSAQRTGLCRNLRELSNETGCNPP